MKLHQDKRDVECSGELVVESFTIKATAKAFAILSSGLYANKIRAVIRELSCNAWDSHVAANKNTTPIEIHLPTALDPTFYVKDFGIGLDDDDVKHLYTTYFESTKADSNDFVGALGLGSKSPFSYTQSFQIESRFNGVKSTYTAFIKENGTPGITRMAQVETDETNGLTVSLQIKRDDVHKFENEASQALMYFTPTPTFLGRRNFKPHSLAHNIVGDGWKVRETEASWMQGAYVVQGFVAYPIDAELMRDSKLSVSAQKVLQLNVDLYVPIGDVDVAASREALQYTKGTISNLKIKLEQAALDMHATVQKEEFDKCTSLWAARMKFQSFEDTDNDALKEMFKQLQGTKPFVWQGKNLNGELSIDIEKIENIDIVLYHKSRHHKSLTTSCHFTSTDKQKWYNTQQKTFHYSLDLHPAMPVLIDDMYVGSKEIIRQFLDDRLSKAGARKYDRYAVVLRATTKDQEVMAKPEIVKILNDLGNPDPMLVSQLGFTRAKKKSYYKKKDKNVMNVWVGFPHNSGYKKNQIRRSFSKLCYKATEINLNDGGWFLPCDKFSVMWGGREMDHLDEILSSAIQLGIVNEADTKMLVTMNEKEQKLAAKAGTWTNMIAHIESEFAKMNANHELDKCCVIAQLVDRLGRGMAMNLIVPWRKQWRDQVEDSVFKNMLNKIVDFAGNKNDPKVIGTLNRLLRTKAHEYIDETVEAVVVEWETVCNQYEMFGLISWMSLTAKHAQIVINYVNTVERARQKI